MNLRLNLPFLSLILSFCLENPTGNAGSLPPLFLKLGEQRTITLPSFQRYSISGTAIRYSRFTTGNLLLIKGIKVGMSTLILTSPTHTSSQTIRVESKVNSPYPHSLFQALNHLENTETIDGGTQFILRGKVSHLKEAQSIAHLKKRFAPYIIDETALEPTWSKRCVQQIAEILKPYPQLKLISQDDYLSHSRVLF
jgi:hypothetical protein